jgi:hypothetical protein
MEVCRVLLEPLQQAELRGTVPSKHPAVLQPLQRERHRLHLHQRRALDVLLLRHGKPFGEGGVEQAGVSSSNSAGKRLVLTLGPGRAQTGFGSPSGQKSGLRLYQTGPGPRLSDYDEGCVA